MSCKVYVWLREDTGSLGHSSMDVAGTYISFWPSYHSGKKEQIFGAEAVYPKNYAEDYKKEGKKSASSIITLNYLWEERIRDYWRAMRKAGWHYTATSLNCSTIVANCLYIGSRVYPSSEPEANEYAPLGLFELKGIWTPRNVLEYASELKTKY